MGLLSVVASARAGVIYQEDFNGSADDLNGAAPSIRPGEETWIATPIFNQDGSLDPDAGSATLAFTPSDDNVYQLDLSLTGVTGDLNWIALGFGVGQSTVIGTNNRFINGLLIGKVWMLFRGDTSGHQAFLGSATSGTAAGTPWAALETETGAIDLRIELDTTGGAGAWAATWFAKKPADLSYTEVRPRETLLDEVIDSVGIALARGLVNGTIESFSLSDSAGSSDPFAITEIVYSPDDNQITLTWNSREGETYAVKYSRDMTNWDADLDDGVAAGPDGQTTVSFDITGLEGEDRVYFRIERQ
jgi:hypothetical protein